MSFTAGSIIGRLDLDTGGFEGGFLRAEALSNLFPSIVTSFLADPLLGFLDVTKHVMQGVSAAIEGGFELIKGSFDRSFENADKLNDMATNAGVAVEALSGLGLVASQAGSGVDAVADAYKFLGKNIAEAQSGNKEAIATFSQIGVSFKDASGQARPLEDVLLSVADALQATDSPAQRTQIAMGLLGRSGTDLLATLTQGSDAIREQMEAFDRYGAVVHRSAADSADAFGDLTGEFAIFRSGLENALAEPLREAITPLLRQLLEWLSSHAPEIKEFVKDMAEGISSGIKAAAAYIDTHVPQMLSTGELVLRWLGESSKLFVSWGTWLLGAVASLLAELNKLLIKGLDLLSHIPGIGGVFDLIAHFIPDASEFARAGADAAEAFNNGFAKTIDKFEDGVGNLAHGVAGRSSTNSGNTNVTVNMQQPTTKDSAQQIAQKIKPVLDDAARQQAAKAAGASRSAAIRRNL